MSTTGLVTRVAGLLHHHTISDGHDEQTAADKLGYTRRADHPWHQPRAVNAARPAVSEPDGASGPTAGLAGEHDTP